MRTLPKELEAKIDEIRSWLIFDGDQKKVATKARETAPRVSQMINKKIAPSKKFLKAGIEVMNENKRICELTP